MMWRFARWMRLIRAEDAAPQIVSPQDSAQQRLAELVAQTLASPDHIVWKARREAALKGLARRQKMEAQG